MMIYVRPFSPVGETVSGTTGQIALSRAGIGTQSVRVLNDGTDTITFKLIQLKGTTEVYSSPDIPILGGSVETFLLPNKVTHAEIVTNVGTGTLYFTTGESA